MTARRIKAPPTKNTLIRLKRQARFLEQGHDLLERKRELLTRLVYERIGEYRSLREQTHAKLRVAYHWLAIARLRMGGHALKQSALGAEPTLEVEVLPRRALGVQYPSVNSRTLPPNPVGLLGTDPSYDETRRHFAEAVASLAKLGEAEMALSRLISEQRKAQKRVNALKYNIIPRYEETIRFISSALEEEERDTLFQIKRLREQSAG